MINLIAAQPTNATNSTTTLTDISHLVLDVPKPGLYEIDALIVYTADDDIRFDISLTDPDAFAIQVLKNQETLVGRGTDSAQLVIAKQRKIASLRGVIKVDTANKIQIMFASSTEGMMARVFRGSILKLSKRS